MSSRRPFLWVAVSLLVTLLFCGIWVGRSLLHPRYEMEAIFQLRPNIISKAFPTGYAGYLEERRQLLESPGFLEPFVDRLSLAERWKTNHEQAVKTLTGIVSVEQVKGTDLLCLKVVHSDQSEALLIATEILNAFLKFENDRVGTEETKESERALELIKRMIRDQEAKISKMENESSASAADLEIERNHLEDIKMRGITGMSGWDFDGVVIHEYPNIRRSIFWSGIWKSLQDFSRQYLP